MVGFSSYHVINSTFDKLLIRICYFYFLTNLNIILKIKYKVIPPYESYFLPCIEFLLHFFQYLGENT